MWLYRHVTEPLYKTYELNKAYNKRKEIKNGIFGENNKCVK